MSLRKKIIYILSGAILAFLFWFIPFTPAFNIGTINQTRYIYSTSTSFQKLVGPGHPGWTQSQEVSKHVLAAFVCAEDGKFYEHKGLDLEAIRKSWSYNQKNKKKMRGGSTITQQVVKVGLLSYERSYVRKIREAVGALLLEQSLSKNEILEWYINMVEFGDGIYGISEASKAYFKVPPEKLTIAQAVSLALVLPAPNKWSKGLKQKNLSLFNQKRFKFILKQMLLGGYITRSQWGQTMASGNFGRPIFGYTEDIRNEKKDEQSEIDPINDLDESDLDETRNQDPKNEALMQERIQDSKSETSVKALNPSEDSKDVDSPQNRLESGPPGDSLERTPSSSALPAHSSSEPSTPEPKDDQYKRALPPSSKDKNETMPSDSAPSHE
ncbi:MAG: transglycosylase domain-containing protein [Pseudomonadota bacterium]